MPITIKSSRMQYRKSNGDYVGVDAVSERKTSEYISEIDAKGKAARDSVPSDYTALSDDVEGLKSALGITSPSIYSDLSLYVSDLVSSSFLLSDRIVPEGSFIKAIRFYAFAESVRTFLYVVNQANNTVEFVKIVPAKIGWNYVEIDYICEADSVIGFYGNVTKYRQVYNTSTSIEEKYRFSSTGLRMVASPKPANVGDTLTINSLQPNSFVAAPIEWFYITNDIGAEYSRNISDFITKGIADNLIDYNVFNLVPEVYDIRAINGVTFRWIGRSCSVFGTPSAQTTYSIFSSMDEMPSGFVAGGTYVIVGGNDKVFLRVSTYINGNLTSIALARDLDIAFTIPSNATGLVLSLEIKLGVFDSDYVNENVFPRILTTQCKYDTYCEVHKNTGVVCFIDDDSGEYIPDIWEPILEQAPIRMGFAVITGIISGNVEPRTYQVMPTTIEYIRGLYNNGHEVYSHTWSHQDGFYNLTLEQIEEECRRSRDWLNDNGFTRTSDIIVYSGGMRHQSEKWGMIRRFYRYGVEASGGINDNPIIHDYDILRYNADTGTLTQLKAMVNRAVKEQKLLVFMNHAYELNKDKANQIQKMVDLINYIKTTDAEIMPLGEALHYLYGWN